MQAVRSVAGKATVAILVELIQGEGGIYVATPEWVKDLRKFCDEKNILLIVDEVQTGMGRTGKLYSWQHYDIVPDIMTLAKSLGGGFPIGAMVAATKVQDILTPGSHGSTFGGNPLACRAALAAYETIEKDKLLQHTREMGEYLLAKLNELKDRFSFIIEIRGKGLMLGVELNRAGTGIVTRARDMGLLINCTQNTVLRIMPAMVVTQRQIDQAVDILLKALQEEPE